MCVPGIDTNASMKRNGTNAQINMTKIFKSKFQVGINFGRFFLNNFTIKGVKIIRRPIKLSRT